MHQASLSFTISQSLPQLMSIESVTPSNHLILCHPLLLLPSIFPSVRVFSNELSALRIRWPKYWNFSFSISRSSEYSGLIDGWDPLKASLLHMSALSVGGFSTWPLGSLRACMLTGFQQDKTWPEGLGRSCIAFSYLTSGVTYHHFCSCHRPG